MLIVDRTTRVGFVPASQAELPEAERTTLYFKPLRKRQSMQIGIKIQSSLADTAALVDTMFEIISKSLVGWSNINDQLGGPVTFDPDDMEENFDIFDIGLLEEASAFVMKISGLTGDDAKN